jgi:hypothetical protein
MEPSKNNAMRPAATAVYVPVMVLLLSLIKSNIFSYKAFKRI